MAANMTREALDFDYLFRIAVNGPSFAGKTSLIYRLAEDVFVSNVLMTIGIDFKFAYRTIEDSLVRYMLVSLMQWDRVGSERFRNTSYYRNVLGIAIVYDCTNLIDFYSLTRDYIGPAIQSKEECTVLALVATKIDLEERTVTRAMGQQLAEESGFLYFETSALDGTGVQDMLAQIGTEIRRRVREKADHL